MKVPNPARRDEDAQGTPDNRWERAGVRCVYLALFGLVLAPIVAVNLAAWCARCTYRIPALGAGSKAMFATLTNSIKSIAWKKCSMKVPNPARRDEDAQGTPESCKASRHV